MKHRAGIATALVASCLAVADCGPLHVVVIEEEEASDLVENPGNQWFGGFSASAGATHVAIPAGGDRAFLAGCKGVGENRCILWAALMSTDGTIHWQRQYDLVSENYVSAFDAIRTETGDFVIVGEIRTVYRNSEDAFVVRLNGEGELLWARLVRGVFVDSFNNVFETSTGQLLAVGRTYSDDSSLDDILVARFDPTGLLLEQWSLGGTFEDSEVDGFVDNDDNVYLCWSSFNMDEDGVNYDPLFLVIKLNPSGDVLWQQTLEIDEDYAGIHGLGIEEMGGDIVVAASMHTPGIRGVLLLAFTTDGGLQWQRIFRETRPWESMHSMHLTSRGELLFTSSYNRGSMVRWLDINGEFLQQTEISLENDGYAAAVFNAVELANEHTLLTGRTYKLGDEPWEDNFSFLAVLNEDGLIDDCDITRRGGEFPAVTDTSYELTPSDLVRRSTHLEVRELVGSSPETRGHFEYLCCCAD